MTMKEYITELKEFVKKECDKYEIPTTIKD